MGRLGRGTFCSIHKCIDLSYSHHDGRFNSNHINCNGTNEGNQLGSNKKLRVVAAKVELSTYINSGVIDGEATVLKHLSMNMPPDMIPTYVDYVKTNITSTSKPINTISKWY